jgi:hypothetical protein
MSKNEWSYTSTPQYAFMAWCLVKHRDNFTTRRFNVIEIPALYYYYYYYYYYY